MEERPTNQILANKDDYQDEFKFDICRSIEEINKLPFEFYVSGGVICKYLLKEHSRYVRDIDIVTKRDLKEVESIFRQHLNVVEFVSSPITELFLEETFICLIGCFNSISFLFSNIVPLVVILTIILFLSQIFNISSSLLCNNGSPLT